ncbi:MAG: hypothetical protein ABFS17_06480 [Chloroflexota bacterium]
MTLTNKITPAVKKTWLYLLSAISWSAIGLYLTSLTFDWLALVSWFSVVWRVGLGILLALAIFRFGFTSFAQSNITRIREKPLEKMCIFGFQKWSSYPLVAVMISLGIFMRKYSPIPKPLLAIIYIGIGGALLFSSYWYYNLLYDMWKARKTVASR